MQVEVTRTCATPTKSNSTIYDSDRDCEVSSFSWSLITVVSSRLGLKQMIGGCLLALKLVCFVLNIPPRAGRMAHGGLNLQRLMPHMPYILFHFNWTSDDQTPRPVPNGMNCVVAVYPLFTIHGIICIHLAGSGQRSPMRIFWRWEGVCLKSHGSIHWTKTSRWVHWNWNAQQHLAAQSVTAFGQRFFVSINV